MRTFKIKLSSGNRKLQTNTWTVICSIPTHIGQNRCEDIVLILQKMSQVHLADSRKRIVCTLSQFQQQKNVTQKMITSQFMLVLLTTLYNQVSLTCPCISLGSLSAFCCILSSLRRICETGWNVGSFWSAGPQRLCSLARLARYFAQWLEIKGGQKHIT